MRISARGGTQLVGSNIEIRPNAVYTLAEVCQILRISDATARRWLKAGKLRAARVGRAYRVLGSQLLDALDQDRFTERERRIS
ncbi:MAG TPA: helix-turn-helix domain-containing protein [Chloroflexota bacterium]|nr:helix-turn-helix domain-containing protein [Chloroflexota bacterium]